MLCVEDTGPGFHAGPGAPIAGALEAATEESRQVESPSRDEPVPGTDAEPSPDYRPAQQERGEGIGLSIVKRLCELLDATIEMESNPGQGTTFRILFPREYGAV
jgi:signal transduction histidine kinase